MLFWAVASECDSRISEETAERIRKAWPEVLARVAGGELIMKVLADFEISRTQQRAFLAREPNAQAQWQAARLASADAFMDMALGEAMANYGKEEAAHARTRIDTLKWAARIRNPQTYSDKQQLDVNVRTIDLTRIIQDAHARLLAARGAPVTIEHVERAPEAVPPGLLDIL